MGICGCEHVCGLRSDSQQPCVVIVADILRVGRTLGCALRRQGRRSLHPLRLQVVRYAQNQC